VFNFGALEPVRLVGTRADRAERMIRFQVAGPPGGEFMLETSTDLSVWDAIRTDRFGELGREEHADGSEGPARYYRAVKLGGL
jgi:hypothetical protein